MPGKPWDKFSSSDIPSAQHRAIDTGGRPRGTSVWGRWERGRPMVMQGRTVIVTGGASGIGKAATFLVARQGARVLIGDIDEPGGEAVAAEGARERLAIEYLRLGLTDKPAVDDFVAAVHQRWGRI